VPDDGTEALSPRAGFIPFLLAIVAIAAMRHSSYLLFHSLAELFSVVIAATFFLLAWHTRRHTGNPALVSLGIVYLSVAVLDVFHTLAFPGMDVFATPPYAANQVWVVARSLQALGLCAFTFFEPREDRNFAWIFAGSAAVAVGGLVWIFVLETFPVCYLEGSGQTPFKVGMELAIIAALGLALVALRARRTRLPPSAVAPLHWSIALAIAAEAMFATYIGNYDVFNMAGHLLKIVSFWLIYRAIVVTGLERPTELLYARLDTKRAALARSNQSLSAVLSILSHDLKGPLSGIAGVSGQLAESVGKRAPGGSGDGDENAAAESANLARRLALIGDTAGNALSLVERVLAWGRAQSGQLEPRPERVDLAALAAEQVTLLADALKSKDLSRAVGIPDGAAALADRELTATILRNFLQNAVKFTPRGGHVRIRAERDGKNWAVLVTDDGVGMSADELSRLDGVERRLRGVGTEGERGSGFGLIMCREFAARMGGSIRVESRQDEGSTFALVLPAAD